MKISSDQLQNELIVIAHHVEDGLKGLDTNDIDYARASFEDIKEAIDRLKAFIDDPMKSEIDRIASEMGEI